MNRYSAVYIVFACFLSSCAMQRVCPAYHSAFILDEYEQKEAYGLFTEVDGVVVPKKPYGMSFKAEEGDENMEKFLAATPGKGFRIQRGKVHPFEKYGFTYENWKTENLVSRIFTSREKPVLENPYLFDKIFKKKPFYKLDNAEMDIVHFNSARYDSIVAQVVDTARYRVLMAEYDSMPSFIQAQHSPLLRGGFNVSQEEYNKRFGGYFLRKVPQPEPEPVDSAQLQQVLDSIAADTLQEKKGIFGIFKRKNKKKKKDEEEDQEGNGNNGPNNDAIREEEEE